MHALVGFRQHGRNHKQHALPATLSTLAGWAAMCRTRQVAHGLHGAGRPRCHASEHRAVGRAELASRCWSAGGAC